MYLLPCHRHKPQIGSGWSVDCSPPQRKHIELLHNFTWGHFIKGGAFWLTFSQPHCFECRTHSFHGGTTVPWFCALTLLCLMRRSEKSSSQRKLCKQSSRLVFYLKGSFTVNSYTMQWKSKSESRYSSTTWKTIIGLCVLICQIIVVWGGTLGLSLACWLRDFVIFLAKSCWWTFAQPHCSKSQTDSSSSVLCFRHTH